MGLLVTRSRYMDDYLSERIRDGIKQLVILGAGYDSRAYRFEQLRDRVRVFEVDSYATQDIKKAKLVKIFGELPNHVTFVPVDFTRETLEKRLAESSYDEGAKTLFIMEGVAMYLNPEAMDNIMSFVNGYSGSESSILFDYFYKSVIDGDEELPLATATRAIIRFREKFQFGIERGQIEGYLTARGFQHIH